MRLAVIHVGQESNDFNPLPTTLRDFEAFGIHEGPEMLERLRGVGEVGGWLDAIEGSGRPVEVVPIVRGWAVAGGRIDEACLRFFERRIRDGLAAAGRIDGLSLQLHGACAAHGLDDVEGEQIAWCREVLGPDVPIVLSLDHHANVTERMVRHATAIVAHRTQPHDPWDTGAVSARLLLRIVAGEVRPVTAFRKLPLLSHQEQFLTSKGPMKAWFDRARAMEAADPRVLHAATCPMQPWLDVDEAGWSVVVNTDGDAALAGRLADELAELAWSMRAEFHVKEALPIDDAVSLADAEPAGVVVLSDTGDTVFGGAAGDSNLILESMLRLRIRGPALVPMVAPRAVERLARAGVGARVTLPLGGEATPFFEPIEVTGTVRRVADGRIALADGHQRAVDMGRTVVFEAGPVTLLLSTMRGVGGNLPDVYRAFGVEPRDFRIAVLKTASNFQWFAPIASRVLRVDTTGPGQSDIARLPWTRLPRPIYPLDEVASWRAVRRRPSNEGAAP